MCSGDDDDDRECEANDAFKGDGGLLRGGAVVGVIFDTVGDMCPEKAALRGEGGDDGIRLWTDGGEFPVGTICSVTEPCGPTSFAGENDEYCDVGIGRTRKLSTDRIDGILPFIVFEGKKKLCLLSCGGDVRFSC